MSFVGDVVGDVIGGVTGAKQFAKASEQAAATQAAASQAGIDETRRQFEALIELMRPYVEGGASALGAQSALTGLQGRDAQQAAIADIESGPLYQGLLRQGEDAILQNAAATGGLRGGNLQGALSQYRPQLLNQLIEQQYSRLGGLSQLGQASAAGQASQGLQTSSNIANLLASQGAATAGGQLARGGVARQAFGDVLDIGNLVASAMSGGAA